MTRAGRRSRSPRAGPDGDGRGGLDRRAWRQPAGLQLAARARGVRPRGGQPRRRAAQARRVAQATMPRRRRGGDRPPRQARHANGGTPTAQLRAKMQKTMQNDCAVFRTSKTLAEGCAKMAKVFAGKADIRVKDRSMIWNSDLMETLEFENLIVQAMAHHLFGRQPQREPRRACARGLPRARRQELAEAHARSGSTRRARPASTTARSTCSR